MMTIRFPHFLMSNFLCSFCLTGIFHIFPFKKKSHSVFSAVNCFQNVYQQILALLDSYLSNLNENENPIHFYPKDIFLIEPVQNAMSE